MTQLIKLEATPKSGLNHIDALLGDGQAPHWNYMVADGVPITTISYTFSTSAGIETFESGKSHYSGGLQAFTATQQANADAALAYIGQLTGIKFEKTSDGAAADLHFASANLINDGNVGLCSWKSSTAFNPTTNEVVNYRPDAWVYVDNAEWSDENATLAPGTDGYQTLLHELGHALGLKHPFEGAVQLPGAEDNTANTLLSYDGARGAYSQYRPYDIAALNFLFGGDGLGGALGYDAPGGSVYLTGSARAETLNGSGANDVLNGSGGNDTLNGGAGTDIAVFSGLYSAYTVTSGADGLSVAGPDGTDWLSSIETLRFADISFAANQIPDTNAPAAPSLSVSKNGDGYLTATNKPLFAGFAEAGATIKVFSGTVELISTTADAKGVWNVVGPALADGSHSVYATATDAANNVSKQSAAATFMVDTKAPAAPTLAMGDSGIVPVNHVLFTGTAEAGVTVDVIHEAEGVRSVLGSTKANANGFWTVTTKTLINETYSVRAEATDAAGNMTASAGKVDFQWRSDQNITGTRGNDMLSGATSLNNGIDGGEGIDTLQLSGPRSGYTITKETTTKGAAVFTVKSATGGADTLVDVERLQFGDSELALDVDGTGGQAYRLYRAAFDRVPDAEGLGYWMNARDNGISLTAIAQTFITSPEGVKLLGANPSHENFLTALYKNVMHRAPDGDGYVFWLNHLKAGNHTQAEVLEKFSESSENYNQVIGSIQNGFEYALWQG